MPFAEFGAKTITKEGKRFSRVTFDIAREDTVLTQQCAAYGNIDVYRSIFSYDSSNLMTAKVSGPLFFDFDTDIDNNDKIIVLKQQVKHCIVTLEQLLAIPFEACRVYFSGGKGFHVIVPAEVLGLGFVDGFKLTKDYKDLVEYVKASWESRYHTPYFTDTQIYDRRRMFRLPNSINSKSGLYKIPCPQSKSFLSDDSIDVMTMARSPAEENFAAAIFVPEARQRWDTLTEETGVNTSAASQKREIRKPVAQGKLLPCVEKILVTSVAKGQRNNVTVALASALFQHDMSVETVYETLLSWNSNNSPPLSESELLRTVMSANEVTKRGWYYGCTTIRNLGYCDNSCKLQGKAAKNI